MGHVEIWFLVISAIGDFTNFLKMYGNLSMAIAYTNSYRNTHFYYSTTKKKSFSILGLLRRIRKTNLSYRSTKHKNKSLNILGLLWKKSKYFYYSTKQKKSLNILGLFYKIEKINISIILPSIKNSFNIMAHY